MPEDRSNQNWRSVLQKIIQSPKERQRIATALGINAITLTRWAKKNSRPQRASLARLVKVVQPQQKGELLEALKVAYPDLPESLIEETSLVVPAQLYRQILKEQASVLENLRGRQIGAMLLNTALELLDPHNTGLAITACLCMPPVNEGTGYYIRSLREQGGRGTFPWTADLEQKSIFLGLNSLAGHVVQTGRPTSVGDVSKERYIPVFAYPAEMEASAAACPIWSGGRIAGCLLAASAKFDHFSQERMDLLINLTYIYAIALNPDDFHDPRQLRLRYIPHPTRQQDLLLNFRSQVNELMIESAHSSHQFSTNEAEKIVWQRIEDRLIQIGREDERGPQASS